MTRSYTLKLRQGAPGDTVAASGLVRDLTAGGYGVSVVGTRADEVFLYDRDVLPVDPAAPVVEIDYRPTVDASARDKARRYCTAAHDAFTAATGITAYPRDPRPRLVLGPDEHTPPYLQPYAVVAGGSKSDIPLKQTPPRLFAEVVDLTAHLNWKQVGRVDGGRIRQRQWAIPGAHNLLGQTDLRQLIRLIAHARVVLCHTSLPMLVAAAFRVPCVAVGGGREDPWLFDDLGVTYLHTVGRLACCARAGCRAVFPAQAHAEVRYPLGTVCVDPVEVGGVTVGRCMTAVQAAEVAAAVEAAARP